MSPPSGAQTVLAFEDQEAVVVEVGGGLRTYQVGGRDVLDGYAADEMCASGRGEPLVPWPNRLAGGHYSFGGVSYQAALDEPVAGNAIHGLGRWRSWDVVPGSDGRSAVATHRLRPSPGYPFDLDLAIRYTLDAGGLTVTTTARNESATACPYALGFHPYLAAFGGLVDACSLRAPGASRYLMDESGIPTGSSEVAGTEWDFRGGRAIGDRRLDTCFTDLARDDEGRATIVVGHPVSGESVSLWLGAAFTHVMLFTGDTVGDPRRRRRGLAVEPMTAAPDAFNSGDGLQVLEPGGSTDATWGITPGG